MRPPRCCLPTSWIDWDFQSRCPAADRDQIFPAPISSEVSGAAFPSVLSTPPSTACSPAHPSTRVTRPGWPSAWRLSCRPCFWFFFFNLCGLCNCSLLYTLVLNGYIGRLSRSLTLSLSFQKFPWSRLPSQFAFVGLQLPGFYYRLFLWKCFFSLECLSAAVIKYFKYLKCFCFASLCFDLQLNMGRT